MLILFDENIPVKIAEGLNTIESTNKDTILHCTITHPYIIQKGGTSDDDWIKFAGENKAIILTFDKDFKNVKSKGSLYIQHNIGVFFCKFDKKEKMYWQIVRLFVNSFNLMKNIIVTTPRPFVYRINHHGKPERFEF